MIGPKTSSGTAGGLQEQLAHHNVRMGPKADKEVVHTLYKYSIYIRRGSDRGWTSTHDARNRERTVRLLKPDSAFLQWVRRQDGLAGEVVLITRGVHRRSLVWRTRLSE